ncbi:MAG: HEAT repeat domain-containing protein [Pirellulaceae bacterium]|nr:HEAT repeat domain-containing protein [Pirellulaceae bacterium]
MTGEVEPRGQYPKHRRNQSWLAGFLTRLLRLPPSFRLGGKRYRVWSSGQRAIRLLQDVSVASQKGESLLPFRSRIRRVIHATPPALLSAILRNTKDEVVVRLTIWILGRSHEHFSTRFVFAHHDHQSPRVRNEVIRTLKRLNAWRYLELIASKGRYSDAREHAIENERPEYADRLHNLLGLLESRPVPEHTVNLFVSDDARIGNGTPPRPAWRIRRVLRRIHLMIRMSNLRRGRFFWPFHST